MNRVQSQLTIGRLAQRPCKKRKILREKPKENEGSRLVGKERTGDKIGKYKPEGGRPRHNSGRAQLISRGDSGKVLERKDQSARRDSGGCSKTPTQNQ